MFGFLSFSIVATVSSDLATISSDLVTVEKPGLVMFGFLSSSILANLIALIALFLAVIGLYKQRKDVVVDFLPNLEILNPKNLYINGVGDVLKVPVIFCTQIDILNASPYDLSFFDLRAFNPRTNISYAIMSQRRFPPNLENRYVQVKEGKVFINQNIPYSRYGALKAHSFTCLDILIYESPYGGDFEDSIVLSFKTPIRTWIKKDPYALTNRKKFKVHGIEYNIVGWQSSYEEMQEAEKQEAASERTCK